MKKPYICKSIGSFGRGLASMAGLFESNLFWVSQYEPSPKPQVVRNGATWHRKKLLPCLPLKR